MSIKRLNELEDNIDDQFLKTEEQVAFIIGIAEMGYRLGTGHNQLNFGDYNVIEYLVAVTRPFLLDADISLEDAHKFSMQFLVGSKWTSGEEDLHNKVCSTIKPFNKLTESEKDKIRLRRSAVKTSLRMISSIKTDVEEDILNSLLDISFGGRVLIQ